VLDVQGLARAAGQRAAAVEKSRVAAPVAEQSGVAALVAGPRRAGSPAGPPAPAPAAPAAGRPRRPAVYTDRDRVGASLGALLAGRLTQKVTNDCLPGAISLTYFC
jgi:hypothetical protein